MQRFGPLTAALLIAAVPALAAQDPVVVGTTPNNGQGDPFRTAAIKLNANDAELYAAIANIQAVLTALTAANPVTSVAGRRGAVTLSSTDLSDATSLGRSILGSSSAASVLSSLGAASLNSPTFVGVVSASGGFSGPLSGNATTASALQTPRTLSLSGDVTGSTTFDGSANAAIAGTLASTGVSAGSYGSSTAIPVLTVDGKGRVTSASTAAPFTPFGPPQGRLTLSSGTPVMTSAVSAASSVIYTPAAGNFVPLWNGSTFVMTACPEYTQALSDTTYSPSAAAASQVYDYFAWNSGGTCRVTRGPAWSAGATPGSNAARGSGAGSTALTRVSGLLTNAAAITNGPAAGFGVYVGTVATDSTGGTVSYSLGGLAAGGSPAAINVWNAYNRVEVICSVTDATASHTYTSSTVRAFNNSTGYRIAAVSGLQDVGASFSIQTVVGFAATAHVVNLGLGLNSTTGFAGPIAQAQSGTGTGQQTVASTVNIPTPLGAYYVQGLEASDGTNSATFYANSYGALSCRLRA